MKYRIYDMYDYYGVVLSSKNRIGEYNTLVGARAGAAEYSRDCDGECDIWICPLNKEQNRYLAIDAEPLDYEVEDDE